ncbi:MAG: hypothetical protein ACLP53_06550, partial [Isosphaeraceae bacterium]
SRATGNPNPMPWVVDWGKTCWFFSVSGIETVAPSTSATLRPLRNAPNYYRKMQVLVLTATGSRFWAQKGRSLYPKGRNGLR